MELMRRTGRIERDSGGILYDLLAYGTYRTIHGHSKVSLFLWRLGISGSSSATHPVDPMLTQLLLLPLDLSSVCLRGSEYELGEKRVLQVRQLYVLFTPLNFSCAGSVLTIDMFLLVSIVGHHAESCTATERLCYNCRQPGHESAACPSPRSVSAKQCYSCGGVGHIQADCPTLRIQGMNAGGAQKCYVSLSLISSEGNTNEFDSTVVALDTFLASALLPLVVLHSVHASVPALPYQGRRRSSASAVAD